MAQIKARLKQVRLENISKFKTEQMVNFKQGKTFTFIGKKESGTADFFEAIRRCCETNIIHSFSCAYDEESPCIVVCTFESEMENVEENENSSKIDTKEDSTTETSNVEVCQMPGHTNQAIGKDDGKSNVIVQSQIPQRAEERSDIASNSNDVGGITKSQTLISIYIKWKVIDNVQKALKVLVLRKENTFSSASIVLSIIGDKPQDLMMHQPNAILDQNDCEQICTENVDLKTIIGILEKLMDGDDDLKTGENNFDNIFHDFVDIEFLFLYGVATLQSSEQIKTTSYEVNHKRASANSYVIHEFIKNRNNNESGYDTELEKKICECLNIPKDIEFKYDQNDEFLNVVIGNSTYSILKAPEDIMAAKYLSITLSKKNAILCIAEPGRDMHLAMIRRMVNLVFPKKEMLGGAMVVLTTHSTEFLTPTNLEHTFIVMNNVDDGSKIRPAKSDNKNEGKEYLTCDILSLLVVYDRILFVEGQSDFTFVETMLHILMNNKDLTDAYLKALPEKLKFLSFEQLMSFLLSLNIEKMDGCRKMSKINNACKDLEVLHNRYFLLDFDTLRDIDKQLSIELPASRESFSLDDLEQDVIFVWDDDLVQTSETVEDTKSSDKGTQCTGIAVKSDKEGVKMIKPGTLEDVIVRFSIHHDLLYHAETGHCNIKDCKGLVLLLKQKHMVSSKPWSPFGFKDTVEK